LALTLWALPKPPPLLLSAVPIYNNSRIKFPKHLNEEEKEYSPLVLLIDLGWGKIERWEVRYETCLKVRVYYN